MKKGSLSKPLPSQSLTNMVLERIKEAMINKELKPGDFLPTENELSKNLGVGKSSIREAVKMLEAIGVVEVKRGMGTMIVNKINSNAINPLIFQMILENGNFDYILELRCALEPPLTIMAMKKATEEDIAAIKHTVDVLEEHAKNNCATVDDDLAFHQAILQATRNEYAIKIGETIFQLFRATIKKSVETDSVVVLGCHQRVFQAFLEGDEAKLHDAIIESYNPWISAANTIAEQDQDPE
ncbi:MAG: FadR/GntR family transcriptional regulator [Eubacteriales bacterium]